MVDLAEAGAHLRHLTLADPPPVTTLRRTLIRRARRRRIAAGTSAALIGVTALVAVVAISAGSAPVQRVTTGSGASAGPSNIPGATISPPYSAPPPYFAPPQYSASPSVGRTRPDLTLPPASAGSTPPTPTAPAGATRPIDYGLLRLRVPDAWQVLEASDSTMLGVSCPPNDLVLFGTSAGLACPIPPDANLSYVSVEPFTGAHPPGSVPERIHGMTVYAAQCSGTSVGGGPTVLDYAVPSLDVTIRAAGDGVAVADSLEPSSLDTLLHQTLPVAIPRAWQSVRYLGFAVRVPQAWPVRRLTDHQLPPGECGPAGFSSPRSTSAPAWWQPAAPHPIPRSLLPSPTGCG